MKTAALAALLALAAAPPDPDWGQWRGPNRDGISPDTGLLKQWPSGGPPLAWKVTGMGVGYSSVSVLGDRIYTIGDQGAACNLIALNAADGKTVWTARLGEPVGHNKYPGPRSSPATDGKLVLALGQHGDLLCVDAATGKDKWRKSLSRDFGGRVGGWRYSESPLLDGDLVVCIPGGSRGAVLALKKESGDVVWQCKEFTDAAEYSSLIAVEIGGVRQYVTQTKSSVVGVAAKDGKLLWRATRPDATAVVPTPVYKDGIVFVASGYGKGCNAYRVTADGGQFKAEEIYAGNNLQNHHGGMILLGDHLYALDDRGSLKCLELKTGKELWSDRCVGKGSIAYADGHLVCRSESQRQGSIALVEATPAGYKEKGRFNQPDLSGQQTWPHPVVFGGKLYIRDQDVLLCYNVKAK